MITGEFYGTDIRSEYKLYMITLLSINYQKYKQGLKKFLWPRQQVISIKTDSQERGWVTK